MCNFIFWSYSYYLHGKLDSRGLLYFSSCSVASPCWILIGSWVLAQDLMNLLAAKWIRFVVLVFNPFLFLPPPPPTTTTRLEALKRFIKRRKGSRSWRTTTDLFGEIPRRSQSHPAPLIQMTWIYELIQSDPLWCCTPMESRREEDS